MYVNANSSLIGAVLLPAVAVGAVAGETVTAIAPSDGSAVRVPGRIWQYRIVPADYEEYVSDPDAFAEATTDPAAARRRVRSGTIRIANYAIYAVPGRDGTPPLGAGLAAGDNDDEDEARQGEATAPVDAEARIDRDTDRAGDAGGYDFAEPEPGDKSESGREPTDAVAGDTDRDGEPEPVGFGPDATDGDPRNGTEAGDRMSGDSERRDTVVPGGNVNLTAIIENDRAQHPREMERVGDVEITGTATNVRYILKFGPRSPIPGRAILNVRELPVDGMLNGYFVEPHDRGEQYRFELRFVSE